MNLFTNFSFPKHYETMPTYTTKQRIFILWQDRVIINRIDNICHAILKGKWPSSSQSFDIPYMMSTPALVSSTCNRSGYTEPEVSESSFSNGVLATQLPKVSLDIHSIKSYLYHIVDFCSYRENYCIFSVSLYFIMY